MNAWNQIGGKPTERGQHGLLDNVDPATARIIGKVPRSGERDVAAAVAAAKKAQPAWAKEGVEERCDLLAAIARRIERDAKGFAHAESRDTGKPIHTSTTIDIPRTVRNFRFFAQFARDHTDDEHPMEGGRNYTHRRPVGVVGLITPWNLPAYLLSWKVAPALAMGNAVVAKPSEFTPTTACLLSQAAEEEGLPKGVLNIVHGLGPEAGQALVAHPDVGAVSFTGGTATGRTVAATAAPRFAKLSLELGGKNATLVLDDADLEAAVHGAVRAGFTNTGQVCLCGSRILVDRSLYDGFLVRLNEAVADLVVGDPMDTRTRLGPLIHHAHRDKVEAYIGVARREGSVTGGERPDLPPPLDEGAFLRPAVATGLAQDSRCIQEEIFGPVVSVQAVAGDDEAVALANDVPYGLAASVFSGDLERARAVAERLATGMVWINDWLVRDLRVPFGGIKNSGVGREGGRWSLEFFSEARNIYHPT